MANATVSKWGNSLGLRIPREVAAKLGLRNGSQVSVRLAGGKVVIEPAKRRRRKWTQAELLKGVTPALCGPELIPDTVGREAF